MAESTLRENRRGATHQNATTVNQARMRVLLQEPFYQHDHLGPGAPLCEITGQGDGDGYYDWAGRRLFLADGEPDPMCPGAYRYQHNPDCCDLEAPDSDPRSRRYEPMHLRHKPGDTWIIDTNRPYDPYDPGPYGSPGWYKDERTGRHRRDETPDPLPAEGWVPPKGAWFPGTADWPEPQPPQAEPTRTAGQLGRGDGDDDRAGGDSRGGSVRAGRGIGGNRLRDSSERGGSDRPPPWGLRGRSVPSEPDEPEEPQRPWGARSGRPSPTPARQPWDRIEPGRSGPGDAGWISGYGGRQGNQEERGSDEHESDGRREADASGEGEGVRRSDTSTTGEYRFSKLREDAFDRFMANSVQLRAAHFAPQNPYLRERAVWVLRWLVWVLAIGLVPMPARLHAHPSRPESTAMQPIPAQPGSSTRGGATHERAKAVRPGGDQYPGGRTRVEGPQPVEATYRPAAAVEADPLRRPGAALAAAVEGARAARKVIADRGTRTSFDRAAVVRGSANRASAAHWRTQPRQSRPRPSPRPNVNPYMTMWEQAFDNNATLILGGVA